MYRKKIIFKNSFTSLTGQIISEILQFVVRIFVLRYIGIEVMGISTTFTSILQTLSLAELGFQTAVVYYLYKPINHHDETKINQILAILKYVYRIIGVIFIVLALVCIPMLKYIMKDIDITETVIAYYIIMTMNIACTYFFAHKRALLLADQKDYISQSVDCLFNIIISILKIGVIILFKNYIAFLFLQVFQTIGTNIIINFFCKKKYVFLCPCKFEESVFKSISRDVKSIFMGKLAGYVYGATDNLILSSVVGTIYVGYLSNYVVFISATKKALGSMFYAMTSIIGNMLEENSGNKNKEIIFRMYSYVRYVLASMIIIPWMLFADDVVKILYGKQYILSDMVVVLLAIDLYIHIVYTPCCEYINGSGYFRIDKDIAILGAIINIVTSMFFVYKMGLEGILLGTVLSQIFFWIGRSSIVYLKVFTMSKRKYFKYISINIKWILVLVFQIMIASNVKNIFKIEHYILGLAIAFLLCELINVIIQLVVFRTSEEQKILFEKIILK
ncbi:MAG: oligosaccharide flippase family protein [Clostridia bacterium]|nr:oligosaccharide flippase family protein [Clostridia bacterium]